MESRTLSAYVSRYVAGVVPLAVLSVLLLAALLMMNAATQNSAVFGRLYSVLLVVNVVGIVLLLVLILLNLNHLRHQYRARVMGTRLTLRLLILFVMLAVLPVSVVFFFSIHTLNRGIDNWFDVKIEQALNDSLMLGRTALDAVKQDLVKNAQEMALALEYAAPDAQAAPSRSLLKTLNHLREQFGVSELTLFAQDGKILAASSQEGPEAGTLLPEHPPEAVLAQVRQGQIYADLDAVDQAGLRLRVVVPVQGHGVGAPVRILQVMQSLPPRYTKLAESVQSAFAEYEKLMYLRGPLKFGFTLTLSLIALLTLLVAVWTAIFSARRLVAPIRELAQATRAVAQGDYRSQIPVTSHDEIGILVESFNDMTRRIHRAQSQIKRSQREAEVQRAYLETVLTHLSSGVLSFDQRQVLRTRNAAADQILGVEVGPGGRTTLLGMVHAHPPLAPFAEAIQRAIQAGESEWQAEVTLTAHNHTRTLMLRGTLLPGLGGKRGGYVVVFDDVTALIQAQRDAAWSEVARRMAHEIKNPLTPIQLSAERIRHKHLHRLSADEQATLERATRTIIEQVESLKSMVNAFSEYARSAQMHTRPVNLNDLIRDVVELYKNERGVSIAGVVPLRASEAHAAPDTLRRPVALRLELDSALPVIAADAGRLRQVLHNLLINSRDALAHAPRPVIRLSTRALAQDAHGWVEMRVEDNGPGFPEALIGRLFEPYVTSKEKGTGLGLAIVKRIIDEHGGAIEVANLASGGGVVAIRLPVNEPSAGAVRTSDRPVRARGGA